MPEDLHAEPPEHHEPALEFPVIGIGASAGGLEAVTAMVRGAGRTGAALVLVQHLDPNHESMMAELLSRKTQLEVRQIVDGDQVAPDVLHVIPPGRRLSLEGGHFRLTDFAEPRGLRRPIDTFFESLALAQGPMAACVVLSGTGADGSTGMLAIKDRGGVCVAQDPEEARYDGMPRAAAGTGLVDLVLAADAILPQLESYFSRRLDPEAPANAEDVAAVLNDICGVLRDVVGHDFSGYKHSTIVRRIERRMQVLQTPRASDYLSRLRGAEDECETLFRDLLINVTAFFRDTKAFEALDEKVIRPLIEGASAADEIRIWVPGCSSGQEAYTLAMLIDDALAGRSRRPQVQIFATDIDDKMIEIARQARYAAGGLLDIPERFREAYTIGLDGQFMIAPRIREMVRFSVHSLIKDPPFSKIDLISCRNMLIYLGEEVQRAVIPLLHFSLREGATLFLGPSENITRRADLFEPVDQRARIFRRAHGPARYPLDLPASERRPRRRRYGVMPETQDFPDRPSAPDMQSAIFQEYAPPFVRVDVDGRVVGGAGDAGLFLRTQADGNRQLSTMLRDGLREKVPALVADARAKSRRMALRDVTAVSPFGRQSADIVAHPLPDGTVAAVFLAKDRFEATVDAYAVEPASREERIAALEDELHSVRFRLKSTVEEVETANEELKSSNEEMMSMNEELQSANEELTTANEELKNKVDELALANADLDAFLQSTDLGIVILDRKQRVRHFNDAARAVFPLHVGKHAQPLGELAHVADLAALPAEVARVVETAEPLERTVTHSDGSRSWILRILPYRGPSGEVEGATLTFSDVTRLTTLERDLSRERERLELALSAGRMGVFDYEIGAERANVDDRVAELFGLGDERHPVPSDVFAQMDAEDRAQAEEGFARTIEHGERYEAEFRVHHPGDRIRWVKGVGTRVEGSNEGPPRIYGLNYDITAEHEIIETKEVHLQEMSHRVKNLFAVLLSLIASMPKDGVDVHGFAASLKSRIETLGQAYDLARQSDSRSSVDLGDLGRQVLGSHGDADRFEVEGPPLRIPTSMLTPFGLILHELATNAVKYGGLAAGGGGVHLSWSIERDGRVAVRWAEPEVPTRPGTKAPSGGFGSRIIEFSARQLSGRFERTFDGGGMIAELEFTPR